MDANDELNLKIAVLRGWCLYRVSDHYYEFCNAESRKKWHEESQHTRLDPFQEIEDHPDDPQLIIALSGEFAPIYLFDMSSVWILVEDLRSAGYRVGIWEDNSGWNCSVARKLSEIESPGSSLYIVVHESSGETPMEAIGKSWVAWNKFLIKDKAL